jgi:hypothetical protein
LIALAFVLARRRTFAREARLQDNGVDFVRSVCALHFRALHALVSMAGNIGVNPGQLDRFVIKGEPLPDPAMSKLIDELFHGKACWDAKAQCIADVVKEPAAIMDMNATHAPAL